MAESVAVAQAAERFGSFASGPAPGSDGTLRGTIIATVGETHVID